MMKFDSIDDMPKKYRDQARKLLAAQEAEEKKLAETRDKGSDPQRIPNPSAKEVHPVNPEADRPHWTQKAAAEAAGAPVWKKYKNRETIVDGHKFDSRGEAERWVYLTMLQAAGEIYALKRQPVFILQEGFKNNRGTRRRPITYRADFEYWEEYQDGTEKHIVEDFKGHKTEAFRIKQKMFEKRYPDTILRITKRNGETE